MRLVAEKSALGNQGARPQHGQAPGSAVQPAHHFHLAADDDTRPLARRGFVKQPFPGFVCVLLPAGEKVFQIGGGNAHAPGGGPHEFMVAYHGDGSFSDVGMCVSKRPSLLHATKRRAPARRRSSFSRSQQDYGPPVSGGARKRWQAYR